MSLKSIFIITIMVSYSLTMTSTTSDGDRRKEKENLESTTRKFQSDLHIGDTADLKREIYKAYMHTYECSYIFSAQIYMRLIEGLLLNSRQLAKVPQNKDLSFVKEAAQMLASLYNFEAMRNNFTKNVMWIVLLFAERALVYMKLVIKGDQDEHQKTIVSVHKSVSLLLEHYMASDDCIDYSKHNKLDDEVTGNFNDLQSLLSALESKKTIIMQRLDTNAKNNNISTTGYKEYSLNTLGLNGLLLDNAVTKRKSFYKILESSEADLRWDRVLEPLKKEYDIGTQANDITLSHQIKSLTTFNDKFILMVKVIIIRLMLMYLTYVNGNLCNTEVIHDIVELEKYLGIQDDGDVESVKLLIEDKYLNVDNTINEIKDYLNQFALKLYDVDIFHSYFSLKPTSKRLIEALSKGIQEEVKLFVKSLKDALVDINFGVIKKFKQLINTREYKELVDIENVLLKT